jgi:hypothetical protein
VIPPVSGSIGNEWVLVTNFRYRRLGELIIALQFCEKMIGGTFKSLSNNISMVAFRNIFTVVSRNIFMVVSKNIFMAFYK